MSVEPHNAFTVRTGAVLPPKPERQQLSPKISVADDAARIRARYRRAWGADCASEANERARLEAKARRIMQSEQIAVILAEHGEMTSAQVQEHIGLSHEQTRVVLRLMRIDGKADFHKKRGKIWWSVTA